MKQPPLLLTVGNIYVDHNVFGVNAGSEPKLELGKDYFADSGEQVLGGSAVNAAMQAQQQGLEVAFIGKTGLDVDGEEVRDLLQKQGIISDLMSADKDLKTSMAVNLIDGRGEFTGVHYGNASKTLCAADINLDHELLGRAQAIYFGGTAKQPKLFKDCATIFQTLSGRGIKVFYDPNRFPATEEFTDRTLFPGQLAHVEGYFPNEAELLEATDKTSVDEALEFVMQSGVKFVALKRGAKGCRVKTRETDIVAEGHKVTPITTVGAGDCFNATFIANYLKGAPLKECAKHATAAAALRVSKNIWPDEAAIQNFAPAL